MKVVFTRQAYADLDEIALYIAQDSKIRALTFVRELRQKAEDLAVTPQGFPLVPRYEASGIRRRPFRNYLIFYAVYETQISIIHILHAARDYEPLLFSR